MTFWCLHPNACRSHAYGRAMTNRAGYFTTKCDKINCDKLEYLNCEVWIENGTIQSRPLIKRTNLGILVQDTSCQSTHSQVVAGLCGSAPGDLSTLHGYVEKATDILIERFVRHFALPGPDQPLASNKYQPIEDIDEHKMAKSRQDVGHIPIYSGLGYTRCQNDQTILE